MACDASFSKLSIKSRTLCLPALVFAASAGDLSSIDCRKEILKGLKELGSRQRKILLLYYSFSKSPDDIVKILNISVRHLYRLKKKALGDLTDLCNKK